MMGENVKTSHPLTAVDSVSAELPVPVLWSRSGYEKATAFVEPLDQNAAEQVVTAA
jgi:hypothetical protein